MRTTLEASLFQALDFMLDLRAAAALEGVVVGTDEELARAGPVRVAFEILPRDLASSQCGYRTATHVLPRPTFGP